MKPEFLQQSSTSFKKLLRGHKQNPTEQSYIASLMRKGTNSILIKIGEKTAEVFIAAQNKHEEK